MAKLGQLLVARGWINLQQLTRALQLQSVAGGRLGTCLLESDAIGEPQLQRGLAEQFGVPAAEIDDLRGIQDEVRELLPSRLARRCRAIPFRVEGGRLDLAMMDPRNLSCQDEIAFATSKRVRVYVLHEIRVLEALERYYREEVPQRYGLILDRMNRARYLWDKTEAKPAETAPRPSGVEQLFTQPPKLRLPPPLPELTAAPSTPEKSASRFELLIPPDPAPSPRTPLPLNTLKPAPARKAPSLAPDFAELSETLATTLPPAAAAEPVRPSQPATPATLVTPEAEPARPVRPPKPKAIELTPEERAELDRPLPVPAPLPPAVETKPENEEEALAALARATDLDQAGRFLVSFLSLRFRRVALFRISREQIQGWMIRGAGIDQDSFAELTLGFDQPSLFLNLRQGSGFHVGPLPPMPAHRQLARLWGGELPRDAVMLPIRLRDRLVTVLYADGPPKGGAGIDLAQLQRLAAALVAAFERFAVAKRRLTTPL